MLGRVVLFLSFVAYTNGIQTCPLYSQRILRAKAYCYNKSTESQYWCLFDEHEKIYKESCTDEPDFVRPGKKYVIKGGLDPSDCSSDRFQPVKLWLNESSECSFAKEYCNELGQITIDNGSTISDRLCRCDYTAGFDFVTKPKTQCFCIPSEEDCSCYRKQCASIEKLSPDYDCIPTHSRTYAFNCAHVVVDSVETSSSSSTTRFQENEFKIPDRMSFVGLVTSLIILFALVYSLMVIYRSRLHNVIICKNIEKTPSIDQNLFLTTINRNFSKIKQLLDLEKVLDELQRNNLVSSTERTNIQQKYKRQIDWTILHIADRSGDILHPQTFKHLKKNSFIKHILRLTTTSSKKELNLNDSDCINLRQRLGSNKDSLLDIINPDAMIDDFMDACIFDLNDLRELLFCSTTQQLKSCFFQKVQETLWNGSFEILLKVSERLKRTNLVAKLKDLKHPRHKISTKMTSCKWHHNNEESISGAVLQISINDVDINEKVKTYGYMSSTVCIVQDLAMYPIRTSGEGLILKSVYDINMERLRRSVLTGGLCRLTHDFIIADKIQSSLNVGRYTVKVILQQHAIVESKKETNLVAEVNVIAENRDFLIENLDTELIVEKLNHKRGEIFKLSDFTQLKDKKDQVENICDLLIENKLEDVFIQVLEEEGMTYILNRLQRSQEIFKDNTARNVLADRIIKSTTRIVSTFRKRNLTGNVVDKLNMRHILSAEPLVKITGPDEQIEELKIVEIIAQILQGGRNAMLSFIDVLYSLNEDQLALNLLSANSQWDDQKIDTEIQDKISITRFKDNTQMICEFELIVAPSS